MISSNEAKLLTAAAGHPVPANQIGRKANLRHPGQVVEGLWQDHLISVRSDMVAITRAGRWALIMRRVLQAVHSGGTALAKVRGVQGINSILSELVQAELITADGRSYVLTEGGLTALAR